ncbi:peptidase S8/S53 domain-containing protein, partial [Aspergillus crustosus]
ETSSTETSSTETSSTETSSTETSSTETSSTETSSGQPTPTTVSDIDDFSAIDCLADGMDNRVLVGDDNESSSEMTPERCVKFAQDGAWKYAGVEYSSQCFVGNTLHTDDKDNDGCDMPCTGDKEKLCGGEGRIQIYKDSSWKNPTLEELADGIRDITDSIDATRKAISTYHDHLEELQDLMDSDSGSNTRVKRDEDQYQYIRMKVLNDQAEIKATLEDLTLTRSQSKRLLQEGRQEDINKEGNVPYSALEEYESSTEDLMQQVENVIQDLDANVAELESIATSNIEPAIEVTKSLAKVQSAITAIGLPTAIAAGAVTGIFVVMTSLLALFIGGSDEPGVTITTTPTTTTTMTTASTTATDTETPSNSPDCDKSSFRAVVIIFKEKTSLADFKKLVETFPEDKDAKMLTNDWQPNFIYTGTIDSCSAKQLNENPVVNSWMLDSDIELETYSKSDSESTKISTKPPIKRSSRNTTTEIETTLYKRGVPTSDSTFIMQEESPSHLQLLSIPAQYVYLDGNYYDFPDLVFRRTDQPENERPIIYIMDSGFDLVHADYRDRIDKVIALGEPPSPPEEGFVDHGTCMISIAAGAFSGMAKEARIVPVDLITGPKDNTVSNTFNLLRLIYHHALENNGFGNSVVSTSFVMFGKNVIWEEAGILEPPAGSKNSFDILYGWFTKQGIVTVAAAHNYADKPFATEDMKDLAQGLPRALGGANRPLIVVGNAQHDNTRFSSSCYEDSSDSGILTLYNYGTSVECATLDSKWMADITGTSGATALTAGQIAYYLSQPDLKAQFQADGLPNMAMNVKNYLREQGRIYKGLDEGDGIPRAALGDLMPCSSTEATPGGANDIALNIYTDDHTLRTKVVTQGTSYIMENMPQCRVFGVVAEDSADGEDDRGTE